MTKIDQLTPDQDRLLGVYADKWTAIGLDCGPTDWKAAMRCIDHMYDVGGLKAPAMVVACDSPAALLNGEGMRKLRGRRRTWEKVPNLAEVYYGQHAAGWTGFYDYMREVLGFRDETEELVGGLLEAPKHIGWCALYEECAYLSAKTSAVRLNTAGGLHSVDAPAIEYPDGFAIYAVHDVVVPAEWVLNRASLDVRLALDHPNVEQRAVAGQLIGWDKVLSAVGAKTVDADPNKYVGTLVEAVIAGVTRRFLTVACPTGREMTLSVDPACATAHEANAWTYGGADDGVPSEGRT
jgi:hypothetical protein